MLTLKRFILFISVTISIAALQGCGKSEEKKTDEPKVDHIGLDLSDNTILETRLVSRPTGSACQNLEIDQAALKSGILRLNNFMQTNRVIAFNRSLDRGNCALSVPVHAPSGKRIVLSNAKLRARVDLQFSDQARTQSEWFFAGSASPINLVTLSTPSSGLISGTQNGIIAKGDCSVSQNLRLNQSQMIQSQSGQTDGSIITESLEVQLSLEDCVQ